MFNKEKLNKIFKSFLITVIGAGLLLLANVLSLVHLEDPNLTMAITGITIWATNTGRVILSNSIKKDDN